MQDYRLYSQASYKLSGCPGGASGAWAEVGWEARGRRLEGGSPLRNLLPWYGCVRLPLTAGGTAAVSHIPDGSAQFLKGCPAKC